MKTTTTKRIALLGAIALGSLTSVKAQNLSKLQKYTNDNLYSATAEFSVDGNWKGVEFQYDWTKTYIEERFQYDLQLTQEGNRVSGTSVITDAQGNYSKMELRGFVLGSKLHFEEYRIIDQLMKRPATVWCLTTGELLIVKRDNKIYLSGTLDGYASDPFSCNQTYVALESEKLNKTESSPLSSQTQGELLNDFLGSRQLMDAYPNPFREDVTIKFSPEIKGDMTLEIIDITGKKIATLVTPQMPATSNEIKFRPTELIPNSGVMFAVLRANGKIYTRQLLQIK